jgi:hypothetical protein
MNLIENRGRYLRVEVRPLARDDRQAITQSRWCVPSALLLSASAPSLLARAHYRSAAT